MSGIIGKIGSKSGTVDELDSGLDLVKPHIIPDVLYPAVAGKLLDGVTATSAVTTGPNSSTVASSKYGTVQSDGRMYYYTDIKGSKPIKDPRIGAHFGSHRHKFKSTQLLEQETATHGENVYSLDGREWIRIVSNAEAWEIGGLIKNNNDGMKLQFYNNSSAFIEIVGYFNDANLIFYTDTNTDKWNTVINGGTQQAQDESVSVTNPLINRYVDAGSVVNLSFNATPTLGINTLKIYNATASTYFNPYGIELIAQDTSNVNNIQIPSQNVVSAGKKFTVSGTPHYDPFNGFTNDTTLFSSVVDMDTSLGLGTATTWGAAWDKGSSNHIRPYNGGRVVKWVASDGTIKTSVNMMPANAQNVSTTAAAEITTPSATNTYLPAFSDDAVDHSLAEVAKTFNWREFGNGAANAGTGAPFADCSMLTTTADDIAYVMDDGLTGLSGEDVDEEVTQLSPTATDDNWSVTFIGTGVTVKNLTYAPDTLCIAQNLPYGTHILKAVRPSDNGVDYTIDGVATSPAGITSYAGMSEITFHQPKMPPIPEDAVVIADYMLMADFVAQTTAGEHLISKGTRRQSCSRDIFYDETDGDSITLAHATSTQLRLWGASLSGTADSDTSFKMRIPSFGTNYVHRGYQSDANTKLFIDTTDNDSNATKDNSTDWGSYAHLATSLTLGVHKFGANAQSGAFGYTTGFDIVTPIHTSSHYQTFETPYLHELIGGDRNMEQTNLVVTPDGKTWDQVTRDVSYIGNARVRGFSLAVMALTDTTTWFNWAVRGGRVDNNVVEGEKRGAFYNKDFAVAYDRFICLKDGQYIIHSMQTTSGNTDLLINGAVFQAMTASTSTTTESLSVPVNLKRGDYIQKVGGYNNPTDNEWSAFEIWSL